VFQRWKVYADKKRFGPLENYSTSSHMMGL